MIKEKRSPALNSTLWLRIVNSLSLFSIIVWECFASEFDYSLWYVAHEKYVLIGINAVSLIICAISWVVFHRNRTKANAVIINTEICAFGFFVLFLTALLLDDTQSFFGEFLGLYVLYGIGIGYFVCVPLSYVALYVALKKKKTTFASITTMIISIGVSAMVLLWELIDLMYYSFSFFTVLGPALVLSTFGIYFFILDGIRKPKRWKVSEGYRIILKNNTNEGE